VHNVDRFNALHTKKYYHYHFRIKVNSTAVENQFTVTEELKPNEPITHATRVLATVESYFQEAGIFLARR
jgi:hypothetical protein